MNKLNKFFNAVYCINLERRSERWQKFQSNLPKDWPFLDPVKFPGIDGRHVTPPDWWQQGNGAWGCFRSHLSLLEKSLSGRLRSVFILEDDAVFPSDFTARAKTFLDSVPSNWEMIYFGGQHLKTDVKKPTPVNHQVVVPFNVNRLHAYALRGRMLEKVYHHLTNNTWTEGLHIDHMIGQIHEQRIDKIYCPTNWIVGQRAGISDIESRRFPERYWN